MAEKREVLDYLRNKQKAAEIESKVNGINLWVLLGAIGLVSWQLLGSVTSGMWANHEIVLRCLICSGALYFLAYFCKPTLGIRSDIRYSSPRQAATNAPFLRTVAYFLLFIPPTGLFIFIEKSLLTGIFAFCSLLFVFAGIGQIFAKIASEKVDTDKLPKPFFVLTEKADQRTDLGFQLFFFLVILDQLFSLYQLINVYTAEDIRSLGLLVTLYLLTLVLIERAGKSHALVWTYELETDLVVGSVSPDVALRRIENRSLGPRLQDVIDRFLDDLDQRFSELDVLLAKCKEQLATVKNIPLEYPAERAARVKEASDPVVAQIDTLKIDIQRLAEYLKQISAVDGSKRPEISQLMISLGARQQAYQKRVMSVEMDIGSSLRALSA